jgi:hypothetical protein
MYILLRSSNAKAFFLRFSDAQRLPELDPQVSFSLKSKLFHILGWYAHEKHKPVLNSPS